VRSYQVDEQNDSVAFWAAAAQTDTAGESVAVGTALLAEGACFTGEALVHRVLEEALLSLEVSANKWRVQARWWLTAQSIGVLLASSRAVALLRRAQRSSTDQARQ